MLKNFSLRLLLSLARPEAKHRHTLGPGAIKLERRTVIETVPGPWQGPVLPLYQHRFETWSGLRKSNSLPLLGRQVPGRSVKPALKMVADVGIEPNLRGL